MLSFRLKVFRAVARHLSFRKAAEELYVSQPAVSLQIKSLEEEVGLQLFDRSGSRIRLTPAGETLLRYTDRLDSVAADAEAALASFRSEVRGRLAIGASLTIAQYVLPRLLGAFLQQNPRLAVGVSTHNLPAIVDRVLEAKIDVVQPQYSFASAKSYGPAIEKLHAAGVGIVAMKVMARAGQAASQAVVISPSLILRSSRSALILA